MRSVRQVKAAVRQLIYANLERAVESLAILVVCLFVAMNLCGPGALALVYFQLNIPAAVVGAAAVFLGAQWFTGVYTWARYLGIVSALMGALAVALVFKHLVS